MPNLKRILEDGFLDSYNEGREDEARHLGYTYGVWSAILDESTCDFCEWADGRTFLISEQHMIPPVHFGDRCVIVYYNSDMLDEGEGGFMDWVSPPQELFPIGSKKKN